MPDEYVELDVNGKVTLDALAKIVRSFDQLLNAIASDYKGGDEIQWVVSRLSGGSAHLRSSAVGGDPELQHTITDAFLSIGGSLRAHVPIRNPRIAPSAYKLVSVLNGQITSIQFRNPHAEVEIDEPAKKLKAALVKDYGVVEGEVDTLQRRRGLQFKLYDSLFDRAVTCFLRRGQEELMREIWGHNVAVQGLITRDPQNGRPLEVHEITGVFALQPYDLDSYKRARGILPLKPGEPGPEITIRQMRDAW